MRAEISDRLYTLRTERRLTQQQLAYQINMSLPSYNALEKGRSIPSAQTLIVLADYFKVSVDYLLGRSDSREH